MSGLEVLNVFSTNPRYRWVKDLSDCVCLVEDEITSLVCVAKYLSKSASNVLLHQFRVEIDVLSTLSCPYVPTLVDVLENQDYIIMIETYIPGISLDVWIKDAGIVKKYSVDHQII